MTPIVLFDTAQIPVIKEATKRRDWFTAITLTATQLERRCYWTIKEHLQSMNMSSDVIDSLLEPLYLANFAKCLLAMQTINKGEYNTIMKINDARNTFIHRRKKEKFKRGLQAQETYNPLIEAAIKILDKKLDARYIWKPEK